MMGIGSHRVVSSALALALVALGSTVCGIERGYLTVGTALAQVTDPALVGAIDIHAHLDPDGYGQIGRAHV